MKLLDSSTIPIDSLIGALLITPNNAEIVITAVRLSLPDLEVMIDYINPGVPEDRGTITLASAADCQIQLGNTSPALLPALAIEPEQDA